MFPGPPSAKYAAHPQKYITRLSVYRWYWKSKSYRVNAQMFTLSFIFMNRFYSYVWPRLKIKAQLSTYHILLKLKNIIFFEIQDTLKSWFWIETWPPIKGDISGSMLPKSANKASVQCPMCSLGSMFTSQPNRIQGYRTAQTAHCDAVQCPVENCWPGF